MDHVENAMDHVSPWATAPKLPSTRYVDNRIYPDPVLFAEAREKILAATWRLVCHEWELPEPGD